MNLEEMSKEDLIKYIKNLSEFESGKYGLVWDKEKEPEEIVVECDKKIPVLSEVKERSFDNSGETNILIEGENFHALSVLNYTHKEAIDIIYIDPPYNTETADFMYNDKFVDENDSYRHSKWLNFMEKRLKIARELLKSDGMIMISIDDNEVFQLKLLCDKVFGEKNLLSIHHIQVRYDNKSLNEKNDWQPVMEYVLIYSKDKSEFKANLPYEEYDVNKFVYSFEEIGKGNIVEIGGKQVTIFKDGEWKIKKSKVGSTNLLKETWASGSVLKGNTSGKFFDLYLGNRKELDGLKCLYKVNGIGDDGLGYRYFVGPAKESSVRGKFYSGIPIERLKELKNGISIKYNPITNYYDYSADFGNISHEGGVGFNSGKKPIKMLKELINYHPNKNAVVLDFFAGSGSTGHAVLDLNKMDGGNRKFILCTNNEVSKKLTKKYLKKYGITEEQLMKEKNENKKRWIDFCNQNGICNTITYPRMTNIINGYKTDGGRFIDGYHKTLKYFRTDFVDVSESKHQLKFALTEKCIPMLCVKEDTHDLVKKTDEYMIFKNNVGKYTAVYFELFGDLFEKFINDLEQIDGKKSIYIFSLDNYVDEEPLRNVKNYTIEPIPYKILEFYKYIIEIGREG